LIRDGNRVVALVNGLVATDEAKASPTERKTPFQSEAAEVFFGEIEAQPLIRG